jgi:hypothetical protein
VPIDVAAALDGFVDGGWRSWPPSLCFPEQSIVRCESSLGCRTEECILSILILFVAIPGGIGHAVECLSFLGVRIADFVDVCLA